MRSIRRHPEKFSFFCHPLRSEAGDKPFRIFSLIPAVPLKTTPLLMHCNRGWCPLHPLSFTLKHELFILQDKSVSPLFLSFMSGFSHFPTHFMSGKDFLPWHYRHAFIQDPYRSSAHNTSSSTVHHQHLATLCG